MLSLALVASAAGQGLDLGVGARNAVYSPGDRLELTIAATNTGGGPAVDFFAGVLLPDNLTVVTIGAGGSTRIGSLARPAAFLPVASGISLGGPFSVAVDPFFQYVWTGNEPRGTYVIFLAAVRRGAFADNRIDAGDVVAIRTGNLSLRQPATLGLEPGSRTSAALTTQGGTLGVTTAAGQSMSLALPAGALSTTTTITATPVTSAPGLPVTRLVGAVQFGPDGLRLRQPATLTVQIPAGAPRAALVGFVVTNDGTGYEPVPVTVSGNTATIRVSHFSAAGVAQTLCGGGVTSAVGLAACAQMNLNLTQAAAMVEDLGSFPIPVRILLASEILVQLRTWLNGFILPELRAAADATNADPTAHYFMLVALREISEVNAILQMTELLDPASGLDTELNELTALVPAAIVARRAVANADCLRDKANYRTHITRILDLAALAQHLSLPVDEQTFGTACVVVDLVVTLQGVVPVAGATYTALATARFSDGLALPDQVVVQIDAATLGTAILSGDTFAQALVSATLTGTVAPTTATGIGPQFDVIASVPELALARILVVNRPHRVLLTSSSVTGSKFLRAGSETSQFSLTAPGGVNLFSETLRSTSPDGEAHVAPSDADVRTNADRTVTRGQAGLDIDAEGSAESRVSFATTIVGSLVGDFDCRFEVTTAASAVDASGQFAFRVLRNGAVLFEAVNTRTAVVPCDAGDYETSVTTSARIVNPSTGQGEASRSYSFTTTLTPRPAP